MVLRLATPLVLVILALGVFAPLLSATDEVTDSNQILVSAPRQPIRRSRIRGEAGKRSRSGTPPVSTPSLRRRSGRGGRRSVHAPWR